MRLWHTKILFYWLVIITLIPLVATINIAYSQFLWGLLMTWICFGILFYGCNSLNGIKFEKKEYDLKYYQRSTSILIAFAFIVFVPLYINFYTGKTPSEVFRTFLLGGSNYMDYQEYFASNDIRELTLNKIPFIISNGIFKFFIVFVVLRTIAFQKALTKTDYITVILITIGLLYSSLGRGTSFEIFELMLLLLFSILLRLKLHRIQFKIPFKWKVFILLVGFGALYLFSLNLGLRGVEGTCAGNDFCLDKNSFLYKISPFLGRTSYFLASYFSFPIYFTSTLLEGVVFSSLQSFFIFLIPFGIDIAGIESYRIIVCNIIICGASWSPDLVVLIGSIGFIGLIPFLYYLGKFSTKVYYKVIQGNLLAVPLLFFLIYYFISLPVGNFITVSSSNLIAIVLSVIFYRFNGFGSFLKKYSKTTNL